MNILQQTKKYEDAQQKIKTLNKHELIELVNKGRVYSPYRGLYQAINTKKNKQSLQNDLTKLLEMRKNDIIRQAYEDAPRDAMEQLKALRKEIQIIRTPVPNKLIFRIKDDVALLTDNKNTLSVITERYFLHNIGLHPNHKFVFFVFDKHGNQQSFPSDELYTPENAKNFYHGVIKNKYEQFENVYIYIYPKKDYEPQDFQLFTNEIDYNCVLETIKRQQPKLSKKVDKINEENKQLPATKLKIQKWASILNIRIIIYNQINVWFDTDPTGANQRVSVRIYADNDHASDYVPIKKTTTQLIVPQNEILKTFQHIHKPKFIYGSAPTSDNPEDQLYAQYSPQAFKYADTIVKAYQPPAPDSDNPFYFTCIDELQYQYKKFINDNHLTPFTNEFHEIAKLANHHHTPIQFNPPTVNLFNYDQPQAFPSFKSNPLYEKFKFFTGYPTLIKNPPPTIINNPGFSLVTNVQLNHPTLVKMQEIQENCWYDHIVLYYLQSNNLASFDITASLFSQTPENLEFPFKQLDPSPDIRNKQKKFNNSFIGKLIAGGQNNNFFQTYVTNTKNDHDQLMYELQKSPDVVDAYDGPYPNTIESVQKSKKQNQFYNLHTNILAYQRTSFLALILQVNPIELISYCVDGFFTTKPQHLHGNIKYDTTKTEQNFSASEIPSPHPINTINVIDIPNYNDHPIYKKLLVNGPPGCGKSYLYKTTPVANSIMLAPDNDLKNDYINDRFPTADTYHGHFRLNSEHTEFKPTYQTIVIDEATKIPREHLTIIEDHCNKYRLNLHLVGDMEKRTKDIYVDRYHEGERVLQMKKVDYVHIFQRPPPAIAGNPIDSLDGYHIITRISLHRRQNDIDAKVLDSFRDMSPAQILKYLREHNTKTITEQQLLTEFKDKQEFTGISAIHSRINHLNNQIAKDYTPITPIKSKATKTTNEHRKGEIVYKPKQLVDFTRTKATDEIKKDYEAAYFQTSDSVQGKTIDGPIIIDSNHMRLENSLYTALTRCRDLNQIHLLV